MLTNNPGNPGNPNNPGNSNRFIGVVALLFTIFLVAIIPIVGIKYGSSNLIFTIAGIILGILSTFLSFLQVFPGVRQALIGLRFPRIPARSALLTILIILLVGLNGIQASIIFTHGPGQITPTPTVPSTATHTGLSSPTPSVTLSPTPTPTITVIPTPTCPSYIGCTGTLVMSDPLKDNSRNYHWDVNNTANPGSCVFTGSGYQFTSNNYFQNCQEYGINNLTNFVLEVTMAPHQGSAGGFILRNTGNNGVGYYIDVGPSGSYSFNRSPNNITLKQAMSSLIQQNQPSYLVSIEASGNQITLYVNQHKIDSVTDGTYSQGRIGFYVTGDCQTCSNTEVTFTNLNVWSI